MSCGSRPKRRPSLRAIRATLCRRRSSSSRSRRSVSSPTRPPRRPITQDTTSKAERDHYFDIGASQIILPGLKAGVDAYYKIASNLLDEGQFGAPIILTPFNYQKGLVKGVEAAPHL